MDAAAEWRLIARCRGGLAAAFEPLVRHYERPALAVARGMLRDADAAEDAVQDAFVRAYRTLGRLEEGSAFGPWFRTILRNLCLDRLRAPRVARRTEWPPPASHRSVWSEPVGTERIEWVREGSFDLEWFATTSIGVGLALLVVGIGYEQYREWKTSPYKDVEK